MSGTLPTSSPDLVAARAARPARPGRGRRLVVTAVLVGSVVLGACGDDDADDPAATTSAPPTTATATDGSTTSTESTTTTSGVPDAQETVRVYFTRGEEIGATGRAVTGTGVARAALEALLGGPDDVESGVGMGTEIPEATEVLGVDIADGVATVDLSDDFEAGGGSLSMQLRVAQVVFTLTQFDTVDTVTIRIEGQEVDGIGGEGVAASDLDRSDLEDLSPAILVESPRPGETVDPTFSVSGTANTFEATYQWAILDADGETVEQDFGTATSGSGTRGTFSFDVDLGDRTGDHTVKVYESSAKDGSEINVVTIPITVA